MEDYKDTQFITISIQDYTDLLSAKADLAMIKDMLKASAMLSLDATRLVIGHDTADTILKYILKDGYAATVKALREERK